MKKLLGLLALLLATSAPAQVVQLPPEIKVPVPGLITVTPMTVDADTVAYTAVDDGLQFIPAHLLKDSTTAVGFVLQPGRYRLRAVAAKVVEGKAKLSPFVECVIVVGKQPDPGPGPGPEPGPTPIPGDGLRVLIVEESSERAKLPQSQLSILTGKAVRDYCSAKCVKGPDGKTPEFRLFDKDVDLKGESKLWQEAMKLPRPRLPWLIIANGDKGISTDLPKTEAEMLDLLKKYGGQ